MSLSKKRDQKPPIQQTGTFLDWKLSYGFIKLFCENNALVENLQPVLRVSSKYERGCRFWLSDDEKSAGIECLVANEMIGLAKELQVDDRVQLLNYHMGHRGRSKKICSLKEMRRFNDLTLPLNAIRHAVNEDLLRPVEGKSDKGTQVSAKFLFQNLLSQVSVPRLCPQASFIIARLFQYFEKYFSFPTIGNSGRPPVASTISFLTGISHSTICHHKNYLTSSHRMPSCAKSSTDASDKPSCSKASNAKKANKKKTKNSGTKRKARSYTDDDDYDEDEFEEEEEEEYAATSEDLNFDYSSDSEYDPIPTKKCKVENGGSPHHHKLEFDRSPSPQIKAEIMSYPHLQKFYEIGRKIVCVGRNYRDHALELKNPIPEKPLIFAKTTNAYVQNGGNIEVPFGCSNLHHEVELGVVISETAKNITKESALDYVGGYAIALDMTARCIQDTLKKAGEPWYLAKSFDTSCPIGEFIAKERVPDPHKVEIYCAVNGKIRQKAKTDSMIFSIPTLLEFITKTITLDPGDLVLTGTPAGVSQCLPGDQLEIGISHLTRALFHVVSLYSVRI